jgi:hypothetical protein
MEGLLGKIGAGIKKFVGNPTVQGIAGAAAFGANPLLGLLAGPGIKNDRERRALENDVLRENLVGVRNQREASDQLQGLLSSERTGTNVSPAFQLEGIDGFTPGTADAAAAGPTAVHNIERGLPATQTQEGQREMMGLLSKVAPQQTAQSLLGGGNSADSRFQQKLMALKAAGIDPNSERGRQFLLSEGTGGNELEALRAMMLKWEIEEKFRQKKEDDEESEFGRREMTQGLNKSLKSFSEFSDINSKLAPTVLRTGALADIISGPVSVYAGARRLLNSPDQEVEQVITDYNVFEKKQSQLLLDILPTLKGMNAGTDRKVDRIASSLANSGNTPGANSIVIASGIEQVFDIADLNKLELDNREYYEDLVDQLKRGGEVISRAYDIRSGDVSAGSSEDAVEVWDPELGRLVRPSQ